MKGKQVTLAHAQQLFAQERETVLVSIAPAKTLNACAVLNHCLSPMSVRLRIYVLLVCRYTK